MPASRPRIQHKPRTKGPVSPVVTRRVVTYSWDDLAPALQAHARFVLGDDAPQRVVVLRPGAYEAILKPDREGDQ